MKEENKLEDIESDFPYQDILYLEHPNPRKHPRQSSMARAGQFSPFAALSGYDGKIKEVSRYVSQKRNLSDTEMERLDEQIHLIQQNMKQLVKITYFLKDSKKSGGKYIDKIGYLSRVDSIHHMILFRDKTSIKMQDVVKIELIDSSD